MLLATYFSGLFTVALAQEPEQRTESPPAFIYFILVDRFHNGHPDNDQTIDTSDIQAFHGGDLAGVEAKIPYLQSIGVDSIWLSPVFSMRTEKFHGHGAFHGYWVQHLDSIEPRFGGEEALVSLSQSIKKQDMKLILDMVYNHVSFDSPMRTAHPDWFHPYPSIADWNDPFQLTHHQVHGLPDLDQTRPPVYQYLLHRSRYWQEKTDVYGFRIDAIRHMENSFLKQIENDTNIWMLGEDFNGNPADLINRVNETNLQALFDFPLYYALTQDLCDRNDLSQIGSIVSLDRYYPEDFQLVRFLDNHDLPRIYSRCGEKKEKVYQALTLLFSLQGIPMLSYGTESWSSGENEPENRKSFQWNAIDQNFVRNIQTLSKFRQEHPVLSKGNAQIVHYTNDQLIIEQSWNDDLSYTILNLSKKSLSFTPSTKASFVAGVKQEGEQISETKTTETPANTVSILLYKGKPTPSTTQEYLLRLKSNQVGEFLLVGSSPALGSWNPNKGRKLEKRGEFYVAAIPLQQNHLISYKIVEKNEDSFIWEEGENHFLWTGIKTPNNLTIYRNDEQ